VLGLQRKKRFGLGLQCMKHINKILTLTPTLTVTHRLICGVGMKLLQPGTRWPYRLEVDRYVRVKVRVNVGVRVRVRVWPYPSPVDRCVRVRIRVREEEKRAP
jgi:hypothetical protein